MGEIKYNRQVSYFHINEDQNLINREFKIGAKFIDFSGQERVLGMKGDWKINSKLVIDDEIVADIKTNKLMSSSVSVISKREGRADYPEIDPSGSQCRYRTCLRGHCVIRSNGQ